MAVHSLATIGWRLGLGIDSGAGSERRWLRGCSAHRRCRRGSPWPRPYETSAPMATKTSVTGTMQMPNDTAKIADDVPDHHAL